jgi:hypothetical protein
MPPKKRRINGMKTSYLLYSLLVSIWVFSDAKINDKSRWWAFGVFILPFITPYYFIKTRPLGKYWKYIGIWLFGFFVFHVTGSVFN